MRKKTIFLIVLFTLLIIPIKIDALTVQKVDVYAPSYNNNVGDEFAITYTASFLGVEKNNTESDGVYLVVYEIEFDDTILGITEINSPGYDSYVYKENGKYYVLSEVNESNKNKCIDNFLACSDYSGILTFKVLKTPTTTTIVKLNNFAAGGFKIDYSGASYTLENMKESENISQITKTINLAKSSETASNHKNIVTETKPIIDDKTISSSKNTSINQTTDPTKSTNNQLMSLEIDGYTIDFQKDRYTYKITIPKDINSLYVTATPKETTSTYSITGADDLKNNNNRVKITVKSESGDEVTYTIIAERQKDKKSNETNNIINKLNKILLIIIGTILVITITVIATILNNKRKLKKLMEE